MANVSQYNTSAGSNNSASPDGFPEGMAPSGVNDAAREVMGALARWYGDVGGSLVSTGSSNAYVVTSNSSHAALADIGLLAFRANHANTGAATLAVDGLTAKDIVKGASGALDSGDIAINQIVMVRYNATTDDFHLVSIPDLGTAALVDTGVSSGNVPAMDATGYPVADGSQITALAGANITADTVPLTAWVHGTEGGTLYYGAAGAPTELAKGTAGQAFVMNSGATAPEWSTLFSTFTSSETALPSAGASATLAHSLTDRTGVMLRAVLRCKVSEGGYSVDDEVDLPSISFDSTAEQGWAVAVDDTNVVVIRGANASSIYNKSTGQTFPLTDSSWRVVVYALRF